MLAILVKVIPILLSLGVFTYVVFNVDYPKRITEASIFQLSAFFIPLFLSLTFLLNIFLNFLLISAIISGGVVILLLLKGLDALNLVSALLVILAVWLFISYFKKSKLKKPSPAKGSNPIKSSLTSRINIPRLKNLTKTK